MSAAPGPAEALRQPYASMRPPDAVVALRSLPRRWGELAGMADDDDLDLDDLARHPGPDGAGGRTGTAIAHARRTAQALRAATGHARAVRFGDEPQLDPPTDVEGAGGSSDDRPFDDLLADVGAGADALAAELEAAPAEAWSRTGVLDGRRIDLVDLARGAVQVGVEGMASARTALEEARRALR
jgi:hypothetical protein